MGNKRIIINRASRLDLESAFDEFQVKNKVRNLSPATLKGYQEGFDRFTGVVGASLCCDELAASTVDRFIIKLMDDGLRPSSVNHYLRCLRSFLYWAMEEGYMVRFKIRMVKEQESVKPTYSDEEIRVLVHEPVRSASFVEWRWPAVQGPR